MKVVGYVRVSTAEQADSGAGLEAQRSAIRTAAEARGWLLVDIWEDAGVSARTLDGPGLTAAVASVESGGADALVVAKVDRLSRSLAGCASLIERAVAKGWSVVALDVGVDTTTAQGEAMANMLATFARLERRLIGDRTRDALAVKRSEGVRLGRPRTTDLKVVKRVLRLHGTGHSYRSIAEKLNADGVPTAQGGRLWYPATVRKLVLSRQ